MSPPSGFVGVHHLKLPVSDLSASKHFYTEVLGLRHIPENDHINAQGELFGVILEMKHQGTPLMLELRLSPSQAEKQRLSNPITWAVGRRDDLKAWKAYLEERKVECSRVLKGLRGWVLCALDPDGRFVRLYFDDGVFVGIDECDADEFWLQ